MQRYTNNQGIDLAAGLWLAHDDYDYVNKPNYLSVTTLIKSVRQIILSARVPEEEKIPDIADRIQSQMGTALHSGIEDAWRHHYKTSLARLGYPKKIIDRIRINPTEEEPDTIPVFTENRVEKKIDGFIIGGKVDLIVDYRLRDVKSTSVYGYMSQKGVGTTWKLQGSIYRWLNQEKIRHDEFVVQYLLRDWSRAFRSRDPKYPSHAAPHRSIQMMSVQETEQWIHQKLELLQQYSDAPDEDIPFCSEEELWRSDPVHKYYAKADAPIGTRSTKNFDNPLEAAQHKAAKGKGRIDIVPGQVRACIYCPAFPICKQKDIYIADGSLIVE